MQQLYEPLKKPEEISLEQLLIELENGIEYDTKSCLKVFRGKLRTREQLKRFNRFKNRIKKLIREKTIIRCEIEFLQRHLAVLSQEIFELKDKVRGKE